MVHKKVKEPRYSVTIMLTPSELDIVDRAVQKTKSVSRHAYLKRLVVEKSKLVLVKEKKNQ